MQQQYNVDAQFVFIFAPAILLDHHFTHAVVGVLCSRIGESTCGQQHVFVCVCFIS